MLPVPGPAAATPLPGLPSPCPEGTRGVAGSAPPCLPLQRLGWCRGASASVPLPVLGNVWAGKENPQPGVVSAFVLLSLKLH